MFITALKLLNRHSLNAPQCTSHPILNWQSSKLYMPSKTLSHLKGGPIETLLLCEEKKPWIQKTTPFFLRLKSFAIPSSVSLGRSCSKVSGINLWENLDRLWATHPRKVMLLMSNIPNLLNYSQWCCALANFTFGSEPLLGFAPKETGREVVLDIRH